MLIPMIVVTNTDGLVADIYACANREDQREAFSVECRSYGYVPHDGDYANGYAKVEEVTVQMVNASPVEELT